MRQHLFLHALVATCFKPTQALSKLGMSKAELDGWMSDPGFASLVNEMNWHKKNFFEEAFLDLVAEREPSAVLHAMKTINSDRGYGTKVTVENTGKVDHKHSMDETISQLPLEDRLRLLEGIRALKEGPKPPKALPARIAEVVTEGDEE